MKTGDFYTHYKGGEYFFDCIALPIGLNQFNKYKMKQYLTQTARHHENTYDLNLYLINGVTFVESENPHVIYQAEKDYDTNKVWAREVDDFFGYKNLTGSHYVKRFSLKK